MELRHLRYFLAVADTVHFRRAAESLHVSQPTLSQQIRQLEKELGTTLFDRIGKGVRLTVAGETFRHYAQRILHVLDEAQVALLELEGLKRGKLYVGAVQTLNTYLIPPIIARFTTLHPGIFLSVEEPHGQPDRTGTLAWAAQFGNILHLPGPERNRQRAVVRGRTCLDRFLPPSAGTAEIPQAERAGNGAPGPAAHRLLPSPVVR